MIQRMSYTWQQEFQRILKENIQPSPINYKSIPVSISESRKTKQDESFKMEKNPEKSFGMSRNPESVHHLNVDLKQPFSHQLGTCDNSLLLKLLFQQNCLRFLYSLLLIVWLRSIAIFGFSDFERNRAPPSCKRIWRTIKSFQWTGRRRAKKKRKEIRKKTTTMTLCDQLRPLASFTSIHK